MAILPSTPQTPQATPTEEPPEAQHMKHRTGYCQGIRTDSQPVEDTTNRTSHGNRTVGQLVVQFIEQSYGITLFYKSS